MLRRPVCLPLTREVARQGEALVRRKERYHVDDLCRGGASPLLRRDTREPFGNKNDPPLIHKHQRRVVSRFSYPCERE